MYFLVIFITIILIDTTITYYHNDDHFHRYHNHFYLVRSNVIFDVRRKGEGDYKWYLLGPSNGVTAIIAPTQHYIIPRDRGRITISWLVLGLCITMCNFYFKILSFEIFRAFLSSQAGRIFFSSFLPALAEKHSWNCRNEWWVMILIVGVGKTLLWGSVFVEPRTEGGRPRQGRGHNTVDTTSRLDLEPGAACRQISKT